MEAVSRTHKPLSRTGEWLMLVTQHSNAGDLFLRCVPGMLLDKIASYIQGQWPYLSDRAQEMVMQIEQRKVYCAKEWLACIGCSTSTYRILDLLQALQKTEQISAVRDMLLKGNDGKNQQIQLWQEALRHQAANSKAKGSMRELTRDALVHLAEVIEKHQEWKLLADGLGLQNEEYAAIYTAVHLLDVWMEKNTSATVECLYFEAQGLKMQSVCDFIDAITPQGIARKNLSMHVEASTLLAGNITRFHIARLNHIFADSAQRVDWHSYMQKFPVYSENSAHYQDCPSNALWQIVNLPLVDLLNDLKRQPQLVQHVHRFEEEIKIGAFNHKSPGGVTLAQVCYLSKADDGSIDRKAEAKDLTFKERWAEWTSSGRSSSTILFSDIAAAHCKLPLQGKELSFAQFLYLFWQYCDELDFVSFYLLLKAVLSEYSVIRQSNLLPNLEALYDEIVPLRSYDPEAANRNQQVASKVHAAGQHQLKSVSDYDETLCIICFDKKREYMLLPCCHLAFCQACVALIQTCSFCSHTVERVVKVLVP